MAMISRRILLAAAGAAMLHAPAKAQQGNAEPHAFLDAAAATAAFQERVAAIAVSRQVTPETRPLAEHMKAFREAQKPRLQALLQAAGGRLGQELSLEPRTILENLEPLDFLALSRRSVEVLNEALAREVDLYKRARASASGDVAAYIDATLPELEKLVQEAAQTASKVK